MDHLRGLLHNEHIYSNLAGPVLGHRVDHRERRTGGPRPLIGMFNSMSLSQAVGDRVGLTSIGHLPLEATLFLLKSRRGPG